MKLVTVIVLAGIAICLSTGYYTSAGMHGPVKVHFFIKSSPTFKIKFTNLFAKSGDYPRFYYLSEAEKRLIIDYCKYRLGIETNLQSQEEMLRCSARERR